MFDCFCLLLFWFGDDFGEGGLCDRIMGCVGLMSKFDWDIFLFLLCVIIFWHEENVAYIYFYFYLVFVDFMYRACFWFLLFSVVYVFGIRFNVIV